MLIHLLLFVLMVVAALLSAHRGAIAIRYGRARRVTTSTAPAFACRPRPPWVRGEIMRLKAWSPDAGCHVIAEVFNRQFSDHGVSVGKTYVAQVLRDSKYAIITLRRELKHRVPRPLSRNRTWALDLTGKTDLSDVLLGLLDHGTRACLELAVLPNKRSLTILLSACRRYGLPTHLRVDNEICLNSMLMRKALALLGIRLQAIQPHCPWQNGRIERFFGTLKQRLDRIAVADTNDLAHKLIEFRAWYNHTRPHQHLHGQTPAEAWVGQGKSLKAPEHFSAWEGALTGWHFPP